MEATRLAVRMLKLSESSPDPRSDAAWELNEIFDHDIFRLASPDEQQKLMLRSSESKYRNELAYPFDSYFGMDLGPLLHGAKALDLGCFTGGRSVAWYQRYHLDFIAGIDVRQVYVEAAAQFAAVKGADAFFETGVGEALPFEDSEFDAVLSFDVLEHVQDVAGTLAECSRVLKPSGKLIVAFPSYYHPTEHHLSLVSSTPCVHWLFGGDTLVRAYTQILAERGSDALWYARDEPGLKGWEKGNTINGTTLTTFERLVASGSWRVLNQSLQPVGSVGRRTAHHPAVRAMATPLRPLTRIPGVRELVVHRISFVLERLS